MGFSESKMKFGKFLQSKSKPEWRLYYMDYKYLKYVIREMTEAIGSGSQSKKEAENQFTKAVEHEINKVNEFFLMIDKEIQAKLLALRQLLNKTTNLEMASKKQAIYQEIDNLATQLNDLYEYTLVNFSGFRKILKKHDRHTGMVASPWFLARCKQQPFYASSKQFGNMLVKLGNCCSRARALSGESIKQVSNPNQMQDLEDYSPELQCTRFWVGREDVMRVKTAIVKHIPVHILTSTNVRFPRETTDFVQIGSCYYDNPATMESYESRVNRRNDAVSIRFRTYENAEQIFVERKTHKANISGSIKERFSLNPTDVFDFVRGTYKLEDYVTYLEQFDQPEDAFKAACRLFAEIQTEILTRNFAPTLSTVYNRTIFQQQTDPVVSISLDTNVQMIKEKLKLENDGKWRKSELQITEEDIHEFPYAIIEIKLKRGKTIPEWVSELSHSPLVKNVKHYSKFTHGVAILLKELTSTSPPWIDEFLSENADAVEERKQESAEFDDDEIEFLDSVWDKPKPQEDMEDNASNRLLSDESSQPLDRSRLQNSSQADVRRVVNDRTPSFWQKLQEYFDFDQRFVKDGKPIMSRMKIEPKTYFANERTFLQWMSFCVIIQGIGVALISFPSENYVGMIAGMGFVLTSILFMAYSLFMFRWRAARIRNNQPGRYDDFWGPVALFCIMTAAVVINAICFITGQLILQDDPVATG